MIEPQRDSATRKTRHTVRTTVARGATDVLTPRQAACRRGRAAGAARAGIIGCMWIDTHCHLDAREFDHDRDAVVVRARSAGVARLVLPAVDAASFEVVHELAQ